MSMYKQFKTSSNLEEQGIILDYGDFRIRVARAGGSNKKYSKLLDVESRPYQRAIAQKVMDNNRALDIVKAVFAEAVIMSWETKVNDKWISGLEGPDGKVIPATVENIINVFNDLPDLFADIQEQAQNIALFREELLEASEKN